MRRYIYAFSVLLLAAAACSKEGPADAGQPNEIRLSLEEDFELKVDTKAGPSEKTISNLSSIYVLATTGTPGNSAETTSPGFTSTAFTKSGTTFAGGKYWPAESVSYHFYAATKALTLSSGAVTFKPSATLADDLYGYVASPTYNASSTAITMNHIYAQVGKCTITAPTGFTVSDLSVTITPKLPTANATFNVRTGAWSSTASHYTTGSAVTLCSAVGSTADNDLWLVPGTYTLTATYKLSANGSTSSEITKTASVSLVMGKNNNISATLPSPSNELKFTVTVTAWSDNSVTATFS